MDAVDITSDYYHRTKAGLFQPDREPLVVEVLGEENESPRPYFRLQGPAGDLWVRAEDGMLVVYMDAQAFFSHWALASESYSARVFREWPVHPVGP